MSQFIYATIGKKDDRAELGLVNTIREPVTTRGSSVGPSGDCVLFGSGRTKDLYYRPERQRWQKSACGQYWIGCYKDDLPAAADLARGSQIGGHFVELVGGDRWLVPTARAFDGSCRLPSALSLGPGGEAISETLPAFVELSRRAEVLWSDFRIDVKIDDGDPALDLGDRLKIAVDFLGLNYHVGVDELNLLQVISTNNLAEVLRAILDVPAWIEIVGEKKNTTGGG